jgi:hypothetical protein
MMFKRSELAGATAIRTSLRAATAPTRSRNAFLLRMKIENSKSLDQ